VYENRGVILVLAYARPELLNELFESIIRLNDAEDISIVVVRQIGVDSVSETLNKWKELIEVLVETDGSAVTAAENISKNRLAGYAVSFDSLGADWVLAVEDDVLLASDTAFFTKRMFEKYKSHRNFRAINLGSRLRKSELGQQKGTCTTSGGLSRGKQLTDREAPEDRRGLT
jgi:hypothetical protein